MSLFSNSPRNRRRRVRRKPSTDQFWLDEDGAKPAPPRTRQPRGKQDQTYQLHAQIGAIESFLAKHHQAEVERVRMKRENILPPPDRSAHKRAHKQMTMAARRRYLAERNRNGLQFLGLFITACGLAWWLIFSGI